MVEVKGLLCKSLRAIKLSAGTRVSLLRMKRRLLLELRFKSGLRSEESFSSTLSTCRTRQYYRLIRSHNQSEHSCEESERLRVAAYRTYSKQLVSNHQSYYDASWRRRCIRVT